jgi:hypothetical protein
MAGRPLKDGLAYYQHDVNMSADEKLEALEAVHGNDGYAVFNKLLERVYKSFGKISLADDVQRLSLARKFNVPVEKFDLIIADAVRFGLFDRDAWETEKRLTSERIRRQLAEVENERESWREKSKGRILPQVPLSPEKIPIISWDNSLGDGGKCDKAEQSRAEQNRIEEQLAARELSTSERADFEAWALTEAKRVGAKRPVPYARTIIADPKRLLEWLELNKPPEPKSLDQIPPTCPDCGREARIQDPEPGRPPEAICAHDRRSWTFDREFGEWFEDKAPSTGDDFEDMPSEGVG